MSHAFIKEGDDQWLHEIQPTMEALIHFLTRENGGIRIYEKKSYFSKEHDRQVHEMNDGLTYAVNERGKWYITDI
jgi:hypothetical protein